ncbi:DLW-39 family protein [Egibacter rhizosphaerae]|nr:DLW-39 family protein [Egibacter rhizosphaerae]
MEVPLRKLLILAATAAGVAFALKKQRERELSEAIWEEPTGPPSA